MASSLNDFVKNIQRQAREIKSKKADSRTPLTSLLVTSISRVIEEIKLGADSDSFRELVIVDLLILASREGYSSSEIAVFVKSLKSEEDFEYDEDANFSDPL